MTTSKFLALVLRHKPETIGLELDESGWVSIDDLLAALSRHGKPLELQQLHDIVENNDKKRFAISEDGKKIRASQGHSLKVDLGYQQAHPPDVLYHGTATRFIASIKETGLIKQNRLHVHLSESIDTASSVGRRYGTLVLLEIDARRMHADGCAFYLSANGVWLTDSVPADYISFPDKASF